MDRRDLFDFWRRIYCLHLVLFSLSLCLNVTKQISDDGSGFEFELKLIARIWWCWFDHLFGVQVDGHDQTVKTQDFGEDKNQNHTDEQSRLLSCASHTSVTDNSDGKAGSQSWETDSQASAEMDEAPRKEKDK